MKIRDRVKKALSEEEFKKVEAIMDQMDEVIEGFQTDLEDLKKKARTKEDLNPDEFTKLEKQVKDLTNQLKEANKATETAQTELKTVTETATQAQKRLNEAKVESELTAWLSDPKHTVKPELLTMAKDSLSKRIVLKQEGDDLKLVVMTKDKTGKAVEKGLTEYLEQDWAPTEGKGAILAPRSTGASSKSPGAPGGSEEQSEVVDPFKGMFRDEQPTD